MEKIGGLAFYNCKGITSVNIPSSVKEIRGLAFFGTGITSVKIPSNVKKIGGSAFKNCPLTNVFFSDTNNWYCNHYEGVIELANLADSATAATYLRETYCGYPWYKL